MMSLLRRMIKWHSLTVLILPGFCGMQLKLSVHYFHTTCNNILKLCEKDAFFIAMWSKLLPSSSSNSRKYCHQIVTMRLFVRWFYSIGNYSIEYEWKFKKNGEETLISKYCLRNGGHFVSTYMCLCIKKLIWRKLVLWYPLVTGGFSSQRASYAEGISMSWRHVFRSLVQFHNYE